MPSKEFRFNPYFSGFRSYTCTVKEVRCSKCKFQSLFQWIPVLYAVSSRPGQRCCLVSILISVDSGLIRLKLKDDFFAQKESFNPYFSGFRSYTQL